MSFVISTDSKGIKVKVKSGTSKAGNEYKLYSTCISTKKQDGTFANAWLDLRFKKDKVAEKPFYNNAKIEIKSSFPMANEYNGNTNLVLFIMDYEVIEEGEKPVVQAANVTPSDDFVNVANSVDLPFE